MCACVCVCALAYMQKSGSDWGEMVVVTIVLDSPSWQDGGCHDSPAYMRICDWGEMTIVLLGSFSFRPVYPLHSVPPLSVLQSQREMVRPFDGVAVAV